MRMTQLHPLRTKRDEVIKVKVVTKIFIVSELFAGKGVQLDWKVVEKTK